MVDISRFPTLILKKARELGADLAGITGVDELKDCPSFTAAAKIPHAEEVGPTKCKLDLKTGEVAWPENGKIVIVVAISHPEDKPELDWRYDKKSPPGNKILINIINELSTWLESKYQIKTHHMPYYVENGGIFLKDAAVVAGLGCIGRNNLLVTPEYGPRVRLRAMIADLKLPSTGPIVFDPCHDCKGYCLGYCPTGAFDEIVCREEEVEQKILPGRIGNYSRFKCSEQMEAEKNVQNENKVVFSESNAEMYHPVKHCRNCEFSCPIGK